MIVLSIDCLSTSCLSIDCLSTRWLPSLCQCARSSYTGHNASDLQPLVSSNLSLLLRCDYAVLHVFYMPWSSWNFTFLQQSTTITFQDLPSLQIVLNSLQKLIQIALIAKGRLKASSPQACTIIQIFKDLNLYSIPRKNLLMLNRI